MPLRNHRLVLLFVLSAVGCKKGEGPLPVDPVGPDEEVVIEVPPYEGDHLLDARTHAYFFVAGHEPVEDDRAVLCRRLFADLIGRYPTIGEVTEICGDRPVGAIVDDLMARDEHRYLAWRQWRDRMGTLDVITYWRYLKLLYEEVDRLVLGEIDYATFASRVLAHPGFITQDFFPADRARRAFTTFLGREATDAEANELSHLFRVWYMATEQDPDFNYLQVNLAYISPGYCEPLFPCSTKLFGGASLDMQGTFSDFWAWEELDDEVVHKLGAVGRLFAEQPIFWDAAADEILERYLGWNDGGRFPRTTGILMPEVRTALALYLRETGDYRGAQKLVLTSWLYRQRTVFEADERPADDTPVWTSGPIKAADAETWIDSAMNLTFDFGTCDPRYPDGFGYTQIAQVLMDPNRPFPPTNEQIAEEFRKLHELSESRLPLSYSEFYGAEIPDFQYLGFARLLGGCPGFGTDRVAPIGTAFAFTQESAAELLCQPGVVTSIPESGGTPEVVSLHVERLFGRAATDAEIAAFETARSTCEPLVDCSDQALVSASCVALLGSAEMLFY